MAAVTICSDFGAQKSDTVSTVSRSVTGTGALGVADLGVAWALLEEVAINPILEPPELTQGWEIDSWRAQQKLVHQDPG